MMNNDNNTLNFVTYNLFSFNQGNLLLNELCNRFDKIAIQEHWLGDVDLDKIIHFHTRRVRSRGGADDGKRDDWKTFWGTKNSCISVGAYLSLVKTEIPAVNPAPGVIGGKLHAWKWVK